MHTYWLLGPTQTYLSLVQAARRRAVTISDLHTENKEKSFTLASNITTSTITKVTLGAGDLRGSNVITDLNKFSDEQ